jgi:hypothetical protein
MAAKQYTECVQPDDYVDLSGTAVGFRNILILLLSGLFTAWLIAVLVGGPPFLIGAIALFTTIVIYLTWWLHGRLICLGRECLVGVVTGAGPSDPADKAGDNDFTMNVLLAPGPTKFTEDKHVYWETEPQGHLVAENDAILGIGRGYVQGGADHQKYVTALHCEFEGDGIHKLRQWAIAILGVLVLALAFDLLGVPILKGLLIILAIILSLFAGSDWIVPPAAPGAGDPRDIDPKLGELRAGHIVVVSGVWVYDSLHHGWNEIHPVLDCAILGEMYLGNTGDPADAAPWPTDFCGGFDLGTQAGVEDGLARWCAKIEECHETEDGGSHDDPANDWVIHPLVDGCKPPPIIT